VHLRPPLPNVFLGEIHFSPGSRCLHFFYHFNVSLFPPGGFDEGCLIPLPHFSPSFFVIGAPYFPPASFFPLSEDSLGVSAPFWVREDCPFYSSRLFGPFHSSSSPGLIIPLQLIRLVCGHPLTPSQSPSMYYPTTSLSFSFFPLILRTSHAPTFFHSLFSWTILVSFFSSSFPCVTSFFLKLFFP